MVVKRLKDVSPLTGEEFAKHMNVLVNLKHPNLLPFLAYYYSKEEKLLIHNVAPHGNLFYRLHGNNITLSILSFHRGVWFLYNVNSYAYTDQRRMLGWFVFVNSKPKTIEIICSFYRFTDMFD